MKKIYVVLMIIVVFGCAYLFIQNKVKLKYDDYVALIGFSNMMGSDVGSQYNYYIYPNKDNTYLILEIKSDITIKGTGKKDNIERKVISSKEELIELNNSITPDMLGIFERDIYYYYVENGERIECSSIDELVEKLF